MNFSYVEIFLLTELQDQEHTTRTGVQEGRPRAVRMHCDKLDKCIINKVIWGVAKETSSVCGCRRRTV